MLAFALAALLYLLLHGVARSESRLRSWELLGGDGNAHQDDGDGDDEGEDAALREEALRDERDQRHQRTRQREGDGVACIDFSGRRAKRNGAIERIAVRVVGVVGE